MLDKIPNSIGLIPDGNRRWARKHNIQFFEAYKLGVKKVVDFSEWCSSFGVKHLAVWALSTENIKNRTRRELLDLFTLYYNVANDRDIINRLHNNKTRFIVVGHKDLLPKRLVEALNNVERETKRYKDRFLYMMLGYGGRDDILFAVKNMIKDKINKINEHSFRRYLISSVLPDIDLIIRTSGEKRLSGFIPWQGGYSELYFSNKLWPDFSKSDLEKALIDYSERDRRFGK